MILGKILFCAAVNPGREINHPPLLFTIYNGTSHKREVCNAPVLFLPPFFPAGKTEKKPSSSFIAKGENNQKRRRDNVIISGSRKKATVVLPNK